VTVRCLRAASTVKDRDRIELVDLPAFGWRARLVWRKHRWACPNRACAQGSWTGEEPTIAAPRLVLTDRAGRWVTEQVGRCGRSEQWRARIEWAPLDLSGPYRAVFDTMLPDATQVADPFHLVKLANTKLDEVRRRVQNDTLGHRGRNTDPLYRCRRLLTRADERVDRSDEQPHQTRETRGVRLQAFPQLPDPHPALRGKPSWHLLPTITPR